jgi:hypothetical protein
MSIKHSFAILAVSAVAATPAFAQGGTDDDIRAIVAAWVASESGVDVPAVIQTFATACFSDLIIALPDDAKGTFLAQEAFVDRMDAVVEAYPELNESVRIDFQTCGETVVVGLDLYAWVSGEMIDAPMEEVDGATACYLEAIHPLPSGGKEAIYHDETFAIGAANLIANEPALAGSLAERLNECGWSATTEPADEEAPAVEPAG